MPLSSRTLARVWTRGSLVAVALLALSVPPRASAQVSAEVSLTAQTQVAVGQTFRLVARADVRGGTIDRFDLPDLNGFTVRSRQVSRPVQIQFGFGQQQVINSSTVHTLLLEATAPGEYDLQPASVVVGGQTFQSEALHISVGQIGQAITAQADNASQTPSAGSGYEYDDTAFVRTVVSNDEPYVGEQIEITVFLYTRSRIRFPNVTREPSADGFWIQDLLPATRTLEARRQTIAGIPFDVYEVRRFAAFPLREGELTIGAPAMDIVLGGGLADIFGSGGNQQLSREGVTVNVTVRPLPEPVPANVLIGSATLEVHVDRESVRTGDAVTLTATLRGNGNLRDIRFALPDIAGVRALEPQVEDTVATPNGQVGGQRKFEWLLVPETPGSHTLPTLRFSTFNAETATYAEVRGPTIVIEAAGNATANAVGEANPTQTEGPVEIRPLNFESLRSTSELRRSHQRLASTPLFWGLFATPPMLYFWSSWRER